METELIDGLREIIAAANKTLRVMKDIPVKNSEDYREIDLLAADIARLTNWLDSGAI